MLKNLKLVAAFGLLCSPAVGFAGDGTGSVEIEHVGTFNGKDLVFFYTSTHTGQPACNTYRSRWVIDISSTVGRSQYSLLLAAQAAGQQVRIFGTNVCDKYDGSETASVVGYTIDYASHP